MSAQSSTQSKSAEKKPEETPKEQQKPAASLEEDDEFEDFPIEGASFLHMLLLSEKLLYWQLSIAACRMSHHSLSRRLTYAVTSPSFLFRYNGQNELRLCKMLTYVIDWQEEDTQLPGGNAHLWEESWDDDDTNEDFAVQLRYVAHASRH